MSSIDSPPESPPATETELERAALREAYETTEGIRRLVRMAGYESLARNLEAEDEAVKQNVAAAEAVVPGVKPSATTSAEAAMRVTAARDVNYYTTTTTTTAQPVGGEVTQAKTDNAATPSKLGTIAKWAGVAALAAGIPGSSFLTAYLMKPARPAAVAPVDPPNFDAGFVPIEGQ